MDCGTHIKEVTEYFHDEDILFSVRALNSETLLTMAANTDKWKTCNINFQDMEVNSLKYQVETYEHHIIAYKIPNKTGQLSVYTNDVSNHMFNITNNWDISIFV